MSIKILSKEELFHNAYEVEVSQAKYKDFYTHLVEAEITSQGMSPDNYLYLSDDVKEIADRLHDLNLKYDVEIIQRGLLEEYKAYKAERVRKDIQVKEFKDVN